MNCITATGIKQDVFSMPVSQPNNESHHGHDRGGSNIVESGRKPVLRVGESCEEPLTEYGGESRQEFYTKAKRVRHIDKS